MLIQLIFCNLDIGANLLDPMYQGIYNGSQKHHPDLEVVLQRSWENNLSRIIITAGSLDESRKALELARTDGNLFIYLFIYSNLLKIKKL